MEFDIDRHLERRAIIATLHKFMDILSGQRLFIQCQTDHKGLQCLTNNDKSGMLTQEEATELQFFNKWRLDIVYRPSTSPIMATADLLSRNLPKHADAIGSFGGEDKERPWGTGNLVEAVGGRDDINFENRLPDDSSTLRIRNPDIAWDGPANDDPAGII